MKTRCGKTAAFGSQRENSVLVKTSVLIQFVTICFTAALIGSCGTTEIMIRNSLGYDVNTRASYSLDSVPQWVKEWNIWVEEKKDDGNHYFIGRSVRSTHEFGKNKDDGLVWSPQDAVKEAAQNAIEQIAQYIGTTVKGEASSSTEVNETSILKKKKKATRDTALSSNISVEASATISGIKPLISFTQEWERTTAQQKKISVAKCWIVYSISQVDIEEAVKIQEALQKAQDEKAKEAVLQVQQKSKFEDLSQDYDTLLKEIEEAMKDNSLSAEKYNRLLAIDVQLKMLSLLKTDRGYIDLIGKIDENLKKYNPADKVYYLSNKVSSLEIENARLQGQIAALEKLKVGYTIETQIVFLGYPPKPQETKIEPQKVYAANDMVILRDYLLYANNNGRKELPKGRRLDDPADNLTWNDAALYCNWLSRLYGYIPCYTEEKGQITGYDKTKNGYRLPEYREIIAMLEKPGFISARIFIEKAVWSSAGPVPQGCTAYILSNRTGTAEERLNVQTFDRTIFSDPAIGFRVVRNVE